MKNIAIITGGYSGEAKISHQSAEMVLNNLDATKYNSYIIDIGKDAWFVINEEGNIKVDKNDFSAIIKGEKVSFDCVFVALHGSPGEDGKIQGYFDMLDIPYTTGGVMNLSATFNKHKTSKLLHGLGYKVAKSILVNRGEDKIAEIKSLGFPCFCKPNQGGSSLGASKIKSENHIAEALEKAFTQGKQVLVEEYVTGIEITCGVAKLDNEIRTLAVTEVVATNEFFDYDAKYHNEGTQEITPARISDASYKKCEEISKSIYRDLDCNGIIRADYFLLDNGDISVIEVNTVPGLSGRSFIPQQAEYAKISLSKLFGDAIENALKRL